MERTGKFGDQRRAETQEPGIGRAKPASQAGLVGSLYLAGLLLLIKWTFHPGPPFEGGQYTPPVWDVY